MNFKFDLLKAMKEKKSKNLWLHSLEKEVKIL